MRPRRPRSWPSWPEAHSTRSRAELAKAIARRLPPGLGTSAEAGREWIEATTAAVLTDAEVVTLASPLSAEVPTGLRRRTIDLSPHRPRTGFERRLDDALGIRRPDDPTDTLLRPPPGRSIDGPDIGLGL